METLVRATKVRNPVAADLAEATTRRGQIEHKTNLSYAELVADPMASWIEDAFGITEEAGSGRLVRRSPTTVKEAAQALASITERDIQTCGNALRATLLAGSAATDEATGRTLFAFRLHQFLSKGGSIHVTAEMPDTRHITPDYQLTVRDPEADPEHGAEKRLYPLAFCRECGQEYLMVRIPQDDLSQFTARMEIRPADQRDGYLFVSADRAWPIDPVAEDRLPLSWRTGLPGQPIVKAGSGVMRRLKAASLGACVGLGSAAPGTG